MNLQVSWRKVATVSACLNLVLLVVLAVVSAPRSMDYLSTLALTLAVIAFVVQIIVFIAQTSASSSQLARSEELHGSTMRALATIEEKAEGTRQTVSNMNDQMLAAFLNKFAPPGSSGNEGNDVAPTDVQLSEMLGDTTAPNQSEPSRPQPRLFSPMPERQLLETPTEERMNAAAETLGQLNDQELINLRWVAQDYEQFGHAPAGDIGHGVKSTSVNKKLYDLGLVKRIRASWGDRPVVSVLTSIGEDAAALLLKKDLSPDAPVAAHQARAKLAAIESRYAEARARHAAEMAAVLDDVPVEE